MDPTTFETLAKAVYGVDGRTAPPPTLDDLATALAEEGIPPETLDAAFDRAAEAAGIVYGLEGMGFATKAEWAPGESRQHALDLMHGLDDLYSAAKEIADSGQKPKHPLAPLIRGWADRPRPVQADRRPTGIFPQRVLRGAVSYRLARHENSSDALPLGLFAQDAQLPFLTELEDAGRIRWSPLVRLVDAAGMAGLQAGRGARLDKRLLVYSLVAVPAEARRPGGRFDLRLPLRQLAHEWLWPKNAAGRSSWRASKHADALRLALDALSTTGIVLPNGAEWRPALVRQLPDMRDLDSEVIIQIALPEGSGHGPVISRPQLYAAGMISDPAFDMEISLSYLWDQAKAANGGHRIYATRPEARRDARGHLLDNAGTVILSRGRPVTDWSDPRSVLTGRLERHPQADRVPMLGPVERHALAFDPLRRVQPSQRAHERARVDVRLESMERAGRVIIERDGSGWRILEAWQRGDGSECSTLST